MTGKAEATRVVFAACGRLFKSLRTPDEYRHGVEYHRADAGGGEIGAAQGSNYGRKTDVRSRRIGRRGKIES